MYITVNLAYTDKYTILTNSKYIWPNLVLNLLIEIYLRKV